MLLDVCLCRVIVANPAACPTPTRKSRRQPEPARLAPTHPPSTRSPAQRPRAPPIDGQMGYTSDMTRTLFEHNTIRYGLTRPDKLSCRACPQAEPAARARHDIVLIVPSRLVSPPSTTILTSPSGTLPFCHCYHPPLRARRLLIASQPHPRPARASLFSSSAGKEGLRALAQWRPAGGSKGDMGIRVDGRGL